MSAVAQATLLLSGAIACVTLFSGRWPALAIAAALLVAALAIN